MAQKHSPLGRPFLTVWLGQTISEIGTMVSAIGAAVYVFLETGSAVWLGVLSAVAAMPAVVATGLASLIDRHPRRTVILAADTLAASGVLAALVLALVGQLEIWHLVMAGFVGGIGNAVQASASQAAVPALVASSQLDRANALKQLGPAIGIVVGPVVATPLLVWWGIEAILIADLLTFGVGIGSVSAVRFRDAPADSSLIDDGSWRDMWLWLSSAGRALLGLMALAALLNFTLAFVNISMLAAATTLAGAAKAGLVLGVAGIAMIVGSLVSASRRAPADRSRTIAGGLVIIGFGFAAAGFQPNVWLLGAGIAIALAAVPAVTAAMSSIYNEQVPSQMQGRVFALRLGLSNALQPLGSLLAGVTIAHVAGPAIQDGILSNSLGRMIGTGSSSGAALVLVVSGLVIGGLAVVFTRSQLSAALAAPSPAYSSWLEGHFDVAMVSRDDLRASAQPKRETLRVRFLRVCR